MRGLAANARMYAVTPGVEALWRTLLERAGRLAEVPLTYLAHPAPAPLEALWARDDLGLAFVCGLPFARRPGAWQPVAAPLTTGAAIPRYRTDLVVRAEDDVARLEDAFGQRIGWTVAHSQSGFNAVRRHLLPHRRGVPLFAASVGPLVTPRRVIEALLAHEIDLGPLDSIWHGLLARHEPETAARLRIIAATEPTPCPLLVASGGVPDPVVARLRAALPSLGDDPSAVACLRELGLAGFAPVAAADYAVLAEEAARLDASGYPLPA